MKILYTGTLDVNAGGPAFSTYHTMRGLNDIGVQTELLDYEMAEGGRLIGTDVPTHFAKRPIEPIFGYAPGYKQAIRDCGEFDVYQAQGIWQYSTYALADVARELHKPYVITPRGMLYPQAINFSKPWLKRMSLRLRLLRDLNRAVCVHVTCEDEMRYCRELGVMSPIAVVPNPVKVESHPEKEDEVFRLGYLGRVSRRKNIESLLYAWDALRDRTLEAELVIIGGGDEEYLQFLKNECRRLRLDNVRFTGFIAGDEKERVLSGLSVLAMPSEFENFGNVIVEGLVRGIPCIATKGAPWKDLVDGECGWWVAFSQEAITAAVKEALDSSAKELHAMGERGKRLVREKYAVEAVAAQMQRLYEWIAGGGEKPEFVYTE